MISTLREIGRLGKRLYLRNRLLRSSPEDKKIANDNLNLREFWHRRTRLHSHPSLVQLGTNWSCNLRCYFCRREVPSYKHQLEKLPPEKREISGDVLARAMEIMPYALSFSLTPLGEPLLFSRFEELLEAHRILKCQNLCMTTNGILLDEQRTELIVRSMVNRIFISVDTPNPERYREMRRGGELQKVIDGIHRIHKWRKKLGVAWPNLTLASTFMRMNIEDLPDLVDFARNLGIDEICVQLMEPEDPSMEPDMLWHHVPLTARMLKQATRKAKQSGVHLNIGLALRNILSSAEAELKQSRTDGLEILGPDWDTRGKLLIEKCRYPWNSLLIDTDGEVRPCCWAGIRFGNLGRQTFQEVWNGPAAQRMRRDFLNNVVPPGCRNKHCRVDL